MSDEMESQIMNIDFPNDRDNRVKLSWILLKQAQ